MTLVKIKISDQEAFILDAPLIASGGVMENYVKFDFSSDWNEYTKVAVFYNERNKPYNTNIDSSGQALIPADVLTDKGSLYIGAFGVNGNTTKTTQMVRYHIEEGALKGTSVVPPLPSIYQEYLNIAKSILAKDTYTKKELDSRMDGNTTSLKKEIDIERKRIDNLTTLQEGSTTGDAELIDGRIGKDGVKHRNIGENIRSLYLGMYLVDGKVCVKNDL